MLNLNTREHMKFKLAFHVQLNNNYTVQSAGVVEYIDSVSAEEVSVV